MRFLFAKLNKSNMKKLLVILLSILTLTAFAQQPDWYDDNRRMADYPSGQYFTGFSEGQRRSGESNDAALMRIKDAVCMCRTQLTSTA